MFGGFRRLLSQPVPLLLLGLALVALAFATTGSLRVVLVVVIGSVGFGVITRRVIEEGDAASVREPGRWNYRDAVFLRSPVSSRWTQGKFRYDGASARWRFFLRPFRTPVEVPIRELAVVTTSPADLGDSPLKPNLYTVVVTDGPSGKWEFGVPYDRVDEFVRLVHSAG